ncbi:hypothetical protein ACFYNO_32725 [Kitasatospora sp. NPDC006697]|uniref:hypothetical protein n=1 Tax=Kitasatospora sp. NPDC006697 TaxID=3364020 RepID=UPI0036CA6843
MTDETTEPTAITLDEAQLVPGCRPAMDVVFEAFRLYLASGVDRAAPCTDPDAARTLPAALVQASAALEQARAALEARTLDIG